MRSFGLWSLFGVMAVIIFSTGIGLGPAGAEERSGEELFKQHCAVCHPDGGNIVNPQKTLHKKDLAANHVKVPADIVNKMRNPGPGMLKFDNKTVSDSDAKKIASYVLSHFNK